MSQIFYLFLLLASIDAFAQEDFDKIVAQALRLQIQADSLWRAVQINTSALATAPETNRMSIMISIRDDDAKAVELQKLANEKFAEIVMLTPDDPYIEKTEFEPQFLILSQSPYSASNPIPIDNPLPDGLAYKIQLGAFGRTLPANNFRGLTPVSGENLGNGVIRYYVGLFGKIADAQTALSKVREYGYRDAFIVAFYNRQPINLERAQQIETAN